MLRVGLGGVESDKFDSERDRRWWKDATRSRWMGAEDDLKEGGYVLERSWRPCAGVVATDCGQAPGTTGDGHRETSGREGGVRGEDMVGGEEGWPKQSQSLSLDKREARKFY